MLYKLIFPQIGEKSLPGNAQDVVGTDTDGVLADQKQILKNTLLFQIS
jgi:hypothetical protein